MTTGGQDELVIGRPRPSWPWVLSIWFGLVAFGAGLLACGIWLYPVAVFLGVILLIVALGIFPAGVIWMLRPDTFFILRPSGLTYVFDIGGAVSIAWDEIAAVWFENDLFRPAVYIEVRALERLLARASWLQRLVLRCTVSLYGVPIRLPSMPLNYIDEELVEAILPFWERFGCEDERGAASPE